MARCKYIILKLFLVPLQGPWQGEEKLAQVSFCFAGCGLRCVAPCSGSCSEGMTAKHDGDIYGLVSFVLSVKGLGRL